MQIPPSALFSEHQSDYDVAQGFILKDTDGIQTLFPEEYSDSPDHDIDSTDVSKLELFGWFGYGFAAESFSVVAITFLIPVAIEKLAAMSSLEISDHQTPCDWSVAGYKCAVHIGNSWIDPTSFYFYTNAVGVGIQAFILVGMGALADHGSARKVMMLSFGILGAITTTSFVFIHDASLYWVASILAIISNISFGTSWVFYNAYLPVLTRHSPSVKEAYRTSPETLVSESENTSNLLSTQAFAIGYSGGILSFFVSFGVILYIGLSQVFSLLVGIAICGIWWAVFMIFPLIYLRTRPGLPLPESENFFFYSYKRLFKTLKSASNLLQVMKFLGAWLLLSDSINTLTTTAVLFATTELGAPIFMVAILVILVPFCAIIGAYGFLFIQRTFSIPTKKMIMIVILCQSLLPLYGILGLFTDIGLKHIWELWMVSVFHGLLLGAAQSFARVLYAEMLPKGSEAQFFSLYAITDKGASWIGPLVMGVIKDSTHQIRYGFFFLFATFLISLLVFSTVNVEKGRKDAKEFAKLNKDIR